MYQNNPRKIGELKAAITAKISEISNEECVRVFDNFAPRMKVCLQLRGGHLEHNWKEHDYYANRKPHRAFNFYKL